MITTGVPWLSIPLVPSCSLPFTHWLHFPELTAPDSPFVIDVSCVSNLISSPYLSLVNSIIHCEVLCVSVLHFCAHHWWYVPWFWSCCLDLPCLPVFLSCYMFGFFACFCTLIADYSFNKCCVWILNLRVSEQYMTNILSYASLIILLASSLLFF